MVCPYWKTGLSQELFMPPVKWGGRYPLIFMVRWQSFWYIFTGSTTETRCCSSILFSRPYGKSGVRIFYIDIWYLKTAGKV